MTGRRGRTPRPPAKRGRRRGRATFGDLVATMARLRAPGGCPWDREQTHRSLEPFLLEEAYETLEAIEDGASDRLREELGDLLLQVVFHAQMAREAGTFTIDDVVSGLVAKLIRRHPHVFGTAHAAGSDAVLARWEEIKQAERSEAAPAEGAGADGGESALDGLARTLPALMLAQLMQARAARSGFAWPDAGALLAKIREELGEVERGVLAPPADFAAGQHDIDAVGPAAGAAGGTGAGADPSAGDVTEELGDLLFAVAGLPRMLGLDGELALRAACVKFRERFARVEQAVRERGRALRDCTPEELAALWRAAR